MDAPTPGPWDYSPDDETQKYIYGADGEIVCKLDNGTLRESANARLIAAAPDLLAALVKVQEALANHRDNPEGRADVLLDDEGRALVLEEVKYCIVDPAIDKATGR